RDQHFDAAAGHTLSDGFDGSGEQRGSAIFQVIAVDAGHDGETKSHLFDGFGDAARLIPVHFERSTFLDRAKPAAPRAEIPENHERRGAPIPTIADIRTRRRLTNRMEFEPG